MKTNDLKIRQIENREIDQIEALWGQLKQHQQTRTTDYNTHYVQQTFSKRKHELLSNDQLAIFIAENDGEHVGFCVVSINGAQGKVDSVFVMPDQRGCNAGRLMVTAGVEWLNNHGIESIRLFVGQGNEEVLSFYEKLGFRTRATMMQLMG